MNPSILLPALLVAALAAAMPDAFADQASQMTKRAAVSSKLNASGIVLDFAAVPLVRVGVPASVVLKFTGVTEAAGGSVQITADPGLALSSETDFSLAAGSVAERTVTFTAGTEGLLYLNVFMTQRGQTSVASVPVRVGNKTLAMKTLGKLRKSGQEQLVVMPLP